MLSLFQRKGEISLAVDGKLYKGLDSLTLRNKLIDLLGIEKRDTVEVILGRFKKVKRVKMEKIKGIFFE